MIHKYKEFQKKINKDLKTISSIEDIKKIENRFMEEEKRITQQNN